MGCKLCCCDDKPLTVETSLKNKKEVPTKKNKTRSDLPFGLVKSIEQFVNQEELIDLMKKNKFENCSYRNLSGGIVAIHSGWKI